ncbi:MAG: hypothetical protein F6K65_38310, partial [Moorea sp. SIO3C2]|nr:hypothetical protein [Moorena sp. SIO3C2]
MVGKCDRVAALKEHRIWLWSKHAIASSSGQSMRSYLAVISKSVRVAALKEHRI